MFITFSFTVKQNGFYLKQTEFSVQEEQIKLKM